MKIIVKHFSNLSNDQTTKKEVDGIDHLSYLHFNFLYSQHSSNNFMLITIIRGMYQKIVSCVTDFFPRIVG